MLHIAKGSEKFIGIAKTKKLQNENKCKRKEWILHYWNGGIDDLFVFTSAHEYTCAYFFPFDVWMVVKKKESSSNTSFISPYVCMLCMRCDDGGNCIWKCGKSSIYFSVDFFRFSLVFQRFSVGLDVMLPPPSSSWFCGYIWFLYASEKMLVF